jgi:hypothetical protein
MPPPLSALLVQCTLLVGDLVWPRAGLLERAPYPRAACWLPEIQHTFSGRSIWRCSASTRAALARGRRAVFERGAKQAGAQETL